MATALEKYKKDLYYNMERLNDEIAFVFHYVKGSFCKTSSFSSVDFDLGAYTDAEGKHQIGMNINQLFKVKVEEQHIDALKFIHGCRQKPWPPVTLASAVPPHVLRKDINEKTVMLNVSHDIFKPLCREVIMEIAYKDDAAQKFPQTTDIKCEPIGMGTVNTWHGTPDVRVRGTEVVHSREVEDEDEDEGSDGASLPVEGKIHFIARNLCQAISTCVISSFTERHLHTEQQGLVPTLLIDAKQFRVILYDSEKDVLLVSAIKKLDKSGRLSRSAMTLLWLVFNHRQFLQEIPELICKKYPAKIRTRLDRTELQHFTELCKKDINWSESSVPFSVDNAQLPFQPISLPPSKKRKLN